MGSGGRMKAVGSSQTALCLMYLHMAWHAESSRLNSFSCLEKLKWLTPYTSDQCPCRWKTAVWNWNKILGDMVLPQVSPGVTCFCSVAAGRLPQRTSYVFYNKRCTLLATYFSPWLEAFKGLLVFISTFLEELYHHGLKWPSPDQTRYFLLRYLEDI